MKIEGTQQKQNKSLFAWWLGYVMSCIKEDIFHSERHAENCLLTNDVIVTREFIAYNPHRGMEGVLSYNVNWSWKFIKLGKLIFYYIKGIKVRLLISDKDVEGRKTVSVTLLKSENKAV